jgi:hypothetical protein
MRFDYLIKMHQEFKGIPTESVQFAAYCPVCHRYIKFLPHTNELLQYLNSYFEENHIRTESKGEDRFYSVGEIINDKKYLRR